jgi:hypothetical protein
VFAVPARDASSVELQLEEPKIAINERTKTVNVRRAGVKKRLVDCCWLFVMPLVNQGTKI